MFETVSTDLISPAQNDRISIYPNPAKDYVTISFNNQSGNSPATFSLSNLTGKQIYKTVSSTIENIQLSTSDFAKEIYILSVSKDGIITNNKLVFQ